jgi:hypothetical protein
MLEALPLTWIETKSRRAISCRPTWIAKPRIETMMPLDFLVITLAASALVDVWRNGSIFALGRATMQAKEDDASGGWFESSESEDLLTSGLPWYWRIVPVFFAKMLNCWFCLSHHTPWILAILFFLPALWLDGVWEWAFKLPVYSLAATRLGTIINAYVPLEAQYDRNAAIPFEEHNAESFNSSRSAGED